MAESEFPSDLSRQKYKVMTSQSNKAVT